MFDCFSQSNAFVILCLKSDSHRLKKLILFVSTKAFKNDEKCFLFHLESFLFVLMIFKYLSGIFRHVGKRLNKIMGKANFKIYNWFCGL